MTLKFFTMIIFFIFASDSESFLIALYKATTYK